MKPILFSGEMVKAMLEGRKTQTRRIVKPQPERVNDAFDGTWDWKGHLYDDLTLAMILKDNCPYGQVGDRLWVRETHYRFGRWFRDGFTKSGKQAWRFVAGNSEVRYMDSPPDKVLPNSRRMERGWFKRVSIHMPRSASRITLEITGVKVERVQEITEDDAIAEGVQYGTTNGYAKFRALSGGEATPETWPTPQEAFSRLWDSINAKRGYGWDVNPWDWALTFKVV